MSKKFKHSAGTTLHRKLFQTMWLAYSLYLSENTYLTKNKSEEESDTCALSEYNLYSCTLSTPYKTTNAITHTTTKLYICSSGAMRDLPNASVKYASGDNCFTLLAGVVHSHHTIKKANKTNTKTLALWIIFLKYPWYTSCTRLYTFWIPCHSLVIPVTCCIS